MTAPTSAASAPPAPFRTISSLVHEHALARPLHPAIVDDQGSMHYAALDATASRVAASLQRDGVAPQQAIAICAHATRYYASVFLGALRAGVAVAPIAPSSTPEQFGAMVRDCEAKVLFVDAAAALLLGAVPAGVRVVAMDASVPGHSWGDWLASPETSAASVAVQPEWPFNLIYSSGTTGTPKGIVQPHGMRWAHVQRGATYGYGPDTRTLLSTPLYSNTTLVVFFPTLAKGGTVVLMKKFDALGYLKLAQEHRITHTMLVPVQYQRLMASPEFDRHDLSSFQVKFCTSAPFHAELKADVLKRWPGGLVEFYGMTEGGGTFILNAHEHPDKLHTVGRAAPGSEVLLINEEGQPVPVGEAGEVVGRSPGMMTGYHGQPEKTREAEWFGPDGARYIRTGDIGRLDADGFLTLFDRRKDMVISGGFNVYPSDLEAVLRQHPAVADAAVVGVPSKEWGETPVAYIVKQATATDSAQDLKEWCNARVGKTQRLSDVRFIAELPRSAIGKVLKRELRDQYAAG